MMNKYNIEEMIKEGCLVTAGDINHYNTMTIGWGMIGTIWRKNTFIVYVKPCRYTYEFMENNEYFTISFYKERYKNEMVYLGTKSGRDEDKVKNAKFHPIELEDSVTFKEAYLTLVCKKYYYQDIDYSIVPEDARDRYYSDNCMHRAYYGEIVKVIKK